MSENYKKLDALIKCANILLQSDITSMDSEFMEWHTKVGRLLISMYGESSKETKDFQTIFFAPLAYYGEEEIMHRNDVEACHKGLKKAIAFLSVYLEDDADNEEKLVESERDFTKIFIVHGHDGELKESVARIIEKQDIEPIILSEKANKGQTIIEKFEAYSNVGAAICLYTADDIFNDISANENVKRARQNVVFESGYFIGKLGRKYIVLLADQDVEMPSDLSGVVYTDTKNWQLELLKDLNEMGYTVDLNKLL